MGVSNDRAATRRPVRGDESLDPELYRLLVESVEEYAIFALDPGGHVITWNAGARRLKGYEAEEVLGEHLSLFYPPETVQEGRPRRALETAAREGRYVDEGWRVRKDGSRFWARAVLTPIRTADGRLVGFSKVTRDLTERREGEEEMRRLTAGLERRVQERTRALAQANRDLEAFTYSVSHDLRAPLRAMEHLARAIVEDHGGAIPPEALDHVQRIHASSLRMSELVDALLGLSRLSRGELVRQRIDLTALARAVADDLRAREPSRAVELVIADGLVAEGDPRLLRVALGNLLGNAWKFTRPVPAPRVEVASVDADGERAFVVRDNGVGFDSSRQNAPFVPFQRFHRATQFEGTGIGLATVQRVVERHGGRLWAESRPGQGAAFFFTLAPANAEG